ncbi:MAG: zinc-binding alcohol dehydrogenase/oxidoreductase [Rhodothermales bacterium]
MRALVLTEPKSPLVCRDEPVPIAAPGESLVQLKAAALNRRDFWITQGLYPGVSTPCILGSDGAGVVDGREVIINPGINWGSNSRAQGENFRILGMPDNGTFAESILVPSGWLRDKPAHLSWEQAAALPLAGLTAYRALFTQGKLKAGQTVLVTGIGGGVATFALQFAMAAGAKVLVTSSSDAKLARACDLGAVKGARYDREDWQQEFADCGPIDLIIDSAAGPGYATLLDLLRPGGTIVNYGATAGPPKVDMFGVFWKQLHIVGCTMGSSTDFAAMLDFVSTHELRPIVDKVVALEDGPALVSDMAKMPQFGKLVLSM